MKPDLQSVLEAGPLLIFRREGPQHRLSYVSPNALRVVGYSPAQLLALSPEQASTLIHPQDLVLLRQQLEAAVKEGRTTSSFRWQHPLLGERWFYSENLGGHDSNGQPYVQGYLYDITDTKQTEAALQAAKEEAEQANRAKTEFLSRMSHELRTPMAAVLGFAELLESTSLSPKQQEYVQRILQAGWHLSQLVDDALDLALVEAGRLKIVLQPVAVHGLALECVELLRPMATEHEVSLDILGSEGGMVMADSKRLKEVLLNLLSNAIKFNFAGGRVLVQWQVLADQALVAISDTGPGIPAEQQHKLFQPFERLGSHKEGTGLGLALSRRLVEAMGGSLEVHSQLGQGTRFELRLRLSSEAEGTVKEPQGLQELPRISRAATLLYIEENPDNLRLVGEALSRFPSISLITTELGSVGLELAQQVQPDLILLDLRLPDLAGEAVLEQLKATPSVAHIPVVIFSAEAMHTTAQQLLQAGAADFLTKPIRFKQFYQVLGKLLS